MAMIKCKGCENNTPEHDTLDGYCLICAGKRIRQLESALANIWPFIEEDFPRGTGENHGTCASDLYIRVAREIEQAMKVMLKKQKGNLGRIYSQKT